MVLSTFLDDALVVNAIQHGARGYVVKDVDTMELVRAIRVVARNGSAFDSRSAAAMVWSIHSPQARAPLTGRELSVLRLVANGLSNRGILPPSASVRDHGEIPRPQRHAQAARDQPRRSRLQGH